MDRRTFLCTAGVAASLAGFANAARADPTWDQNVFGRSATEFGIRPNVETDQSLALQRALNDAAANGTPLTFPPGLYSFRGGVRVSGNLSLLSPAMATLSFIGTPPFIFAEGSLALRGLTFAAGPEAKAGGQETNALIVFKGRSADIDRCSFLGLSVGALDIATARAPGLGLSIVRLTQCQISSRAAYSIKIANAAGSTPALVSGNQISGSGLYVEGDSLITGNTIGDAPDAGVRLGRPGRLGFITATNNMIYASPVGIAISNAPDGYAMATINMIRGAKNGAIRAFDGDRYVGKDLAQSSSESFPHIAVGGNVSV